MKPGEPAPAATPAIARDLARALGARRTARLKRLMRLSGLPPEALLDLALELLDLSARKLSPSPIRRSALGLGAARWRHVSPEERSRVLREAARARWAKHRRRRGGSE